MKKPPLTKKKSLLVLIVLIVLAGLLFFVWRSQSASETVSPRRGDIVEAIYALGKVKSRHQYDLTVGVFSTVQKVYVREGDPVEKDSPLVKFVDSGIFKSPFSGVITLLGVEEGESAPPSVVLLRVDDLKDRYVEVSLEQQGALRVQVGQKAEIVFESIRGEKLQGRVSKLYSKNDEFLAHIEVDGLMPNVLPGMTADVAITVGNRKNALLIPVRAISNGQVIVLRDGKRTKLPVKIGAIDGQMAEIIEGSLLESDQLVIGRK